MYRLYIFDRHAAIIWCFVWLIEYAKFSFPKFLPIHMPMNRYLYGIYKPTLTHNWMNIHRIACHGCTRCELFACGACDISTMLLRVGRMFCVRKHDKDTSCDALLLFHDNIHWRIDTSNVLPRKTRNSSICVELIHRSKV